MFTRRWRNDEQDNITVNEIISQMFDEIVNNLVFDYQTEASYCSTQKQTNISTNNLISEVSVMLSDCFNAIVKVGKNRNIYLNFPSGETFEIAISKL